MEDTFLKAANDLRLGYSWVKVALSKSRSISKRESEARFEIFQCLDVQRCLRHIPKDMHGLLNKNLHILDFYLQKHMLVSFSFHFTAMLHYHLKSQ